MPKSLHFFIALSLIVVPQLLYAAPLRTLSLDFTRELTEKDTTEHIAGALHYDATTSRVVVEVTEPLQQIMVVKDKVLEIYYPAEQQAFRFISEGRIPMPFVESIIRSTQAEHGLAAIGYSLEKHDIVADVLYTHWQPPQKAKDALGPIILGSQDDKLISAEIKDPKGRIIGRSHYQNHSRIGTVYIPMIVTSTTYDLESKIVQNEHIVYSNPQVNVDPPNQILNFAIPATVEVQEIKW